MIKIAVDVMGMDKGSKVAKDAILRFLKDYKDVELVLFGKEEDLVELKGRCSVIDCQDVMGMEDGALAILRKKADNEGISVPDIRSTMKKDFDIVVANGQNELKDKTLLYNMIITIIAHAFL